MSGGKSDRQWLDIIGIIKVQSNSLDKTYLTSWAENLEVADLLHLVYQDAGIVL